jgi:surface antigen
MQLRPVGALLAIALMLTACGPDASKQDTGTVLGAVAGGVLGNAVGQGRGGRAAATIVGAVVGGIVGSEIGRSMDERDRRLAQQAEYDAFERGQQGVVVSWRNPDSGRYGEITPGASYRRAYEGGYWDCRDYTHKIYIDGRPQYMRGTACRNPDGTWRNVA